MKKFTKFVLPMVLFTLTSCGDNKVDTPDPDTPVTPDPDVPDTPDPDVPDTPKDPKVEIDEKIEKALTKKELISRGTIKFDSKSSYDETSTTSVFEYGEDSLHFNGNDYGTPYDMYLIKDGDDIVAIKKDKDGNLSKPYQEFTSLDYEFSDVITYGSNYYGVESLVSSMYELAKNDVNKDVTYKVEDGAYNFSFGYFETLDGYNFYKVDLTFKVGEKEEFKEVNLKIDTYNSDSFLVDSELGVIQLSADASASMSKTYTITQEVGERSFVSPYKLQDFYATSYDLVYQTTTLSADSELTLEKGGSLQIEIKNLAPQTANFSFDTPKVSYVGVENGMDANYSTYSNSLNLSAYTVGDYVISFETKNVTKTFKVKVTEAMPKEINVSYNVESLGGYTSYVINNDEFDAYIGLEYVINTSVNPYEANQEIKAEIKGVDASKYELVKKSIKINEYMDAKDYYVFKAKEEGDYTITLTSTTKADVTKNIVVHVLKTPTFKEVLSKKYAIKEGSLLKYYFSFAPDGTGESGTLTLEDRINKKTDVSTYSITKEDKAYKINLTHVSGDTLSLDLYMNFDYSLVYKEGNFYSPIYEATNEFLAQGTYAGSDQDASLTISLMNNNEASIALGFENYMQCYYEIKEADGKLVGTFKASEYTNNPFITLPLNFEINSDFNKITIKFSFDSKDYSFELDKSSY